MNTYADDLAVLFETLDLKKAVMVGHSTGGAVPPVMLKSEKNPGGLAIEVFDGIRAGVENNRSQFFKDLSLPFFGYNRPGAKISEGVRENFWFQGMQGGIKGEYDCVKAFSETDFTEDLKRSTFPRSSCTGTMTRSCPF